MLVPDLSAEPRWQGPDPEQAAKILAYGVHSLLSVPLHARGAVLGMANFWRAENPEPFDRDDLTFAEELVARAAVCVDNARRYTREHEMAVTLQRSLLPRGLPEQDALDVAYRYMPAQEGVGGDWFDVIPLTGTRVALVVGDVVGHGLHAAATMGRLRTAVHNFSTLDLPADELLARVDELVARIDQEEHADGGRAEVTGATCLYAVYDPVAAPAPSPGPAIPVPSWCCPTARCSSPTSRQACLWASADCLSRQWSCRCRRGPVWCSTPTVSSSRASRISIPASTRCATPWPDSTALRRRPATT